MMGAMSKDVPVSAAASPAPAKMPATPIPNSYWVEPGRLLAGEYPGSSSRAEAMDRVQRLLRAGVDTFIDLTEEDEMPGYAGLLAGGGALPVRHKRLAIVDHGVPEPTRMQQILDEVEAALTAGRCVYVHCRAGIGRTGTTIGCHLIRTGYTAAQALDRLQVLWLQSARSRSWPAIPETLPQHEFIECWSEPERGAAGGGLAERCSGALVGLALGDALGGWLAAQPEPPRPIEPQAWAGAALSTGADTVATVAAAESLLTRAEHDPQDQLQRYEAGFAQAGAIVPVELKRALAAWKWSRKSTGGTHDPKNLDPHTLARSLAAALYRRIDPAAAIELAVELSRPTQQSPVILDSCRLWTALLLDALAGADKTELLRLQAPVTAALLRGRKLRKELGKLLQHDWRGAANGRGNALSVIAQALMAWEKTEDFASGLLVAIDDTAAPATAGALYGAIAGAHYGSDALPPQWQRELPQAASLRALARRFVA